MSKRILIPILGFAPQGGYRVLSELANAWLRQGHECAFLVPATSSEPYFPTNARVIRYDRSGKLWDHPTEAKPSGFDNIASLWAGLRKVAKDYDVILANHSLTAWPVSFVNCGDAKKLYYIQAHEPGYYPPHKHPIKYLLAKWSYRLNLVQLSNSNTYKAAGLNPVSIIPPGIDLSVFTQKKPDLDFENKPTITLGTIGRTEPYKGTGIAISAYRALRQSDPRFRMRVAFGNVAPDDDLEIVPLKGDARLAEFYRSIDVLIVSCNGQFGAPHYPLIEAMASGTPVVQTGYYPGTPDNSWLAADSSTSAVTQALRDLLATPNEELHRRVQAARTTVERDLAWEAVATKFAEHFS